MKFSIRGQLKITLESDKESITQIINNYTIYSQSSFDGEDVNGEPLYFFEVLLNTQDESDKLWQDLLPKVDVFTGTLDRHQCSHDESVPRPCIISETYRV